MAKTPFLQEETKYSIHRAPAEDGNFVECPCCLHTFSTEDLPSLTHKAGEPRKITEIWKDKIQKYGENKENADDGASPEEGWLGHMDDAKAAFRAGGKALSELQPADQQYHSVF